MGPLWGLALPLFFCCWEAGVAGSSTGPSTSSPDPLVTANSGEEPAVTAGPRTSSEGDSWSTDVTETSAPGFITLETQTLSTNTFSEPRLSVSLISEAETREATTISPATKIRPLTETMPSMFMDVITTSEETPATRSSSTGTRMTAVETDPGCDPAEAIFDSLCTDDSSEEARRVTTDVLTLTHTTPEAEGLSPDSSASPANSVPAITTSQVLAPDLTTPANTFTYIEVTYHSKTEIETAATIPGSSDTGHTPTGGVKGSTSETAALPQSTEAVSHDPETMNFAEALSMASTAESATPDPRVDSPPPTTGTAERETTAATATTPSGVSVTVHTNSSEETAVPSVETLSYLKVSGVVMVSTEAGSTVGRAASSAGPPGYSSAEGATRNPSPSETSTPDNITTAPFSIGRSPLPSVHPSTANSSRDTNTTLAKTIASSQASMKPPTATPTPSWTRQTTKVTANGEEGFLLLRLSVASPEDLTDPRVAERLMHQLRHQLHAHVPLSHVSLLRVKRG